jgi:hypothetical protein
MPVIGIVLASQRGRALTDPVARYILESKRAGVLRDERDIEPASKRFTVDAAPDDYTLHLEVGGFHATRKNFRVKSGGGRGPIDFPVKLEHRCIVLPAFGDLDDQQAAWLRSYDKRTDPKDTWAQLSDNECCAFFQITYALLHTTLKNGRRLAEYISGIDQIGGARIINTLPEGKRKSATGWRLHAHIAPAEPGAKGLEEELKDNNGYKQDGFVVDTHKKFGFIRSYRESGDQPHFQFVFNRNSSMADVDLDDPVHRSTPHDIYPHLKKRFRRVADVYQVE